MAANGAQYGVATVNYYWIGAIPAMVFLGLVMMPFYYGSKVRSVPEYLLLRFNTQSHVFNSSTFALATVLIAGVNLYALALVLKLLLGWPIIVGIIVAAVIVAAYITLGGLSSAIYNEVLQFFVILAALIPITVDRPASTSAAGAACRTRSSDSKIGEAGLHALQGTNPGDVTNPIGATLDRASCSASASCSRSATGRRTSPRSSARSRPRTCRAAAAHAADRRDPEALPAVRDDPAGHDRARRDPGAGLRASRTWSTTTRSRC